MTIAARRRERARLVAARTGATAVEWPPAPDSWDVLVNATPVGTAPDIAETPLPDGPFGGHLVYDLVYNPPETRLLRDARAAGLPHDRRPGDAGRPGAAAVRMVDRQSASILT